jgi:hypothetical protein
MAWNVKVSHPRILPPNEGSPPRPANVEQIIEEEHAREMPDTLTIIRDVVHIVDDIVVRQAGMTKEEIVQEVMRIALPLRIRLPGGAGGRGMLGSRVDYD